MPPPIFRIEVRRLIKLFGKFLLNIPFAPITLTRVASRVYQKALRRRTMYCLCLTSFCTLFVLSITLCSLEIVVNGMWTIGLFTYICFCGCMAAVRGKTRDILGIEGNLVEDFVISLVFYPCVAVQLEMAMKDLCTKEENTITSL